VQYVTRMMPMYLSLCLTFSDLTHFEEKKTDIHSIRVTEFCAS